MLGSLGSIHGRRLIQEDFIASKYLIHGSRFLNDNARPILILGLGFLGKTLVRLMSNRGLRVHAVSRNQNEPLSTYVDVWKAKELEAYIYKLNPIIIINTIALSSYYWCELKPNMSYGLNISINEKLVAIANNIGAKFVFFSSSYIFKGDRGDYAEGDSSYSESVYSSHKRLAESMVCEQSEDFLIVRLDTLFGEVNPRFWRVGSSRIEGVLKIINMDLWRKPIHVEDAAIIVLKLLEGSNTGIYHVAGNERIKYTELLEILNNLSKIKCSISVDDPTNWIVIPPIDSTLNTEKLVSIGIATPIYLFDSVKKTFCRNKYV